MNIEISICHTLILYKTVKMAVSSCYIMYKQCIYRFDLFRGGTLMTIEEMKTKKREKGYTYNMMSQLSGVPLGTIQKIFNGETKSPRYDTLMALERIFQDEGRGYIYADRVMETGAAYSAKVQGEYTIDDYRALPEERRVELIDGCIYDLAAPTTFHQLIAGEAHRQISNFILERDGKCIPFISPIDVQLDCDNRTMVQPDVVILCDENKFKDFGIFGAPDFVLEVTSKSTKTRDYGKKLAKYMEAGVREYWIVNPYQKNVLVYHFPSEVYPVIYSMDVDIPVGIYEGELVINLSNLIGVIDKFLKK